MNKLNYCIVKGAPAVLIALVGRINLLWETTICRARFQTLLHTLSHLQLRSKQRSQFATQNLLKMEMSILIEIWNRRY